MARTNSANLRHQEWPTSPSCSRSRRANVALPAGALGSLALLVLLRDHSPAAVLQGLGFAMLPTAITRVHCVCRDGAADTGVLRALLMLAGGGVVAEPTGSDAGRAEPRALRTPGLGALVTGDSDAGKDASRTGLHGRAAVVFAGEAGAGAVCAVGASALAGAGTGVPFCAAGAGDDTAAVRLTGIGMTNPGLFPRRTWTALRCKGSSGASHARGGAAIIHVGVAGTHIL